MDDQQLPPQQHPPLKIATDDVLEKFQAKMHDVRIKEHEIDVQKKAQVAGAPYIDLRAFPIAKEALSLIPEAQATQHRVVCFFFNQDQFRLGALAPSAPAVQELVHQLQERHHAQGKVYLISEESFRKALETYKRFPVVKAVEKGVTISQEDLSRYGAVISSLDSLRQELLRVNITDIVTLIIAAALKLKSSDIHIEAEKEYVAVRYRIDGVLQEIARLPHEQWPKIVSRIKLVAALKINISDKPQDGRYTIRLDDGDIDVRVSTLPTVYGESVVMRVLKTMDNLALEELGFDNYSKEVLMRAIGMPNGMIITTGPTGSGKTTTMYAMLKHLNKPDVKIITLEDPVEYKLEGINQSQIDPSKDFTFAGGLRAMLRQDPDIAMVGEIRDLETADTAINAALTGHLLLSTVHTNSAAGAIPRFLAMGVKPFLLAPALRAVIGQRLVRKLCPECKQRVMLNDAQKKRLQDVFAQCAPQVRPPQVEQTVFYGPGSACTACDGLGYKGRIGIYEIYEMTPQLAEAIGKNEVGEDAIQATVVRNGMITMAQDGVFKAIEGKTSLDEVFSTAE